MRGFGGIGRFALAAAMGAASLVPPQPACAAPIRVVEQFNGSATDIGIQREPGGTGGVEYRIRGELSFDGSIDLSRATVTWLSILEEVGEGAAGELMKTIDDAPVVPLVIPARYGSEPDDAVFETRRYRPQTRFRVRRGPGGSVVFRLKMDRGLVRAVPALCTGTPPGQTSHFRHRFVLDDGENPPLEVDYVQAWSCSNLRGFQLKARADTPPPGTVPRPQPSVAPTPAPAGASDDDPPKVNLVVGAVTRTDRQTDIYELDARGSSDRAGGALVRFRFESGDGREHDGPDPVARFTYGPGEYTARVTVWDDRGAWASTTRRFSDR